MRKKLISISAIVAILCLTSVFVIWTSAETSTMNLTITATGGSFGRGKGNCFQASSGTIEVGLLPPAQTYGYTNEIGNVSSTVSYSYDLASLSLVEEIRVHIHIDGSFRRLSIGETAPITLLEIMGCTSIDSGGVQYCVNANYAIPSPDVGNIGTVKKTGSNTWWVDALIPAHEQGGPSLCVSLWEQGDEPMDGFCIPLYNFEVVCTGEIAN
jgi:hypothetical protein